ncbi:hypothetical protein [Citreimonas salinaria]|uniref:MetA-pathway of phenol degradation n=1 Tax=Citreimonas salinaria TaxID=321339 RepID=A0A1H3MCT5_9RHOB|nr:hypothetical protein [Citreimonas salinaria]SDY73999.1 hypothetical protein SAMN05444340_11676 [Citreimonas salinaria]
MRLRILLTWAMLAGLYASIAQAGAWPRDKGSLFAAATVRLAWPQDIATWTSTDPTQVYRTIYVEYGLTSEVTVGLDLGRAVSGAGKTVAFVQYPLRQRDTGPAIAAQMGFGRIAETQIVRPGLSVGWSLPHGWLSFDGVAEIGLEDGAIDYKLDITWGRNLRRDAKLIVQLQTGDTQTDEPFARLAPSFVIPINSRLRLESGVAWGVAGDTSMGVTAGLWSEF